MRFLAAMPALFLASFTMLPANATAGEAPTLSYESQEGCPSRFDFWSQLRARSERLKRTAPGELAGVGISVRMGREGGGFQGWLKVVEPNGTSLERTVPGSTCSDVSAALALIGAVILDGSMTVTSKAVAAPRKTKGFSPQLALGVTAGLHDGIAPKLAPTLGLGATVRGRGDYAWAEMRLEGLVGFSPKRAVEYDQRIVGQASFQWMASRISGCAMPFSFGGWRLGPCALLELGALRGTGDDGHGEQHKTSVWIAPGLLLNAGMRVGPLWLRAGAGAVRPIVRDKFMFSAQPVIAQAPILAMISEIELAWAID